MENAVRRCLLNPKVSRAVLVATAVALAVLPVTQGYLALFEIVAGVVLLAAFVDSPAWIRLVLAGLASLIVMSMVAWIPSEDAAWTLVGPTVALLIPIAAVWRLWFVSWSRHATDPHLLQRRHKMRWAVLLLGIAALLGATLLISTETHPSDPDLLSGKSNCGSVIRPRSFNPLEGPTGEAGTAYIIFSVSSLVDCEFALEDRLGWALLSTQIAVALIALSMWPRRTSIPLEATAGEVTQHSEALQPMVTKWLLRRPILTLGLLLGALATIAALLTMRLDKDIALVDKFNAQAVRWVDRYGTTEKEIDETAMTVARALIRDDFPEVASQCEHLRVLVTQMESAPRDLPDSLQVWRYDLEAFLHHVDAAATLCIAGGRANSAELVREAAPEFRKAAEILTRMEAAIRPH